MFQRALQSWGRLVGRQPATAALEEDRRVWVRYPCDVETTCQPADGPGEVRLSARVQNISRGGINLVVNRRLEPGAILTVDLPGPDGQSGSTVLAYVVRVAGRPGGEWAVGCTFAAELSDEDLEPFGARRQRPHDPDQRGWVRFPCDAEAFYYPVNGTVPKPLPARAFNISPVGVGLLVPSEVPAGTLVSVELRSPRQPAALTIMASVVRVTGQPGGEWALGCNFIRELSEKELQALL